MFDFHSVLEFNADQFLWHVFLDGGCVIVRVRYLNKNLPTESTDTVILNNLSRMASGIDKF